MRDFGNFYKLITNKNDPRHKKTGAIGIKPEDCREANDGGADIFWTPNGFNFGKRTKADLKYINCFWADLDAGSLQEMQRKFKLFPEPSSIIKTGKGYHGYWWLKQEIDCCHDPIKMADWFRDFKVTRIIPALNADSQAADACHLLRAPFYKYWKDGLGEIYTDIVWESDKFYELSFLEKYFPAKQAKQIIKGEAPKIFSPTGSFWTKANSLPVVSSLERLSGTEYVTGEVYKLRRSGKGFRIDCNGKMVNAWIDDKGAIGSVDGAGPQIPNWLWYYHRDWKKVADVLKKAFPELGEING